MTRKGWFTSMCDLLQTMVVITKPFVFAITVFPNSQELPDHVVGNTFTMLVRHDACMVIDTHKHSSAPHRDLDIGVVKVWTAGLNCFVDMAVWIYGINCLLGLVQL